jgi:hypothetical protein
LGIVGAGTDDTFDYELVATVYAFEHTFDPNGAATLLAFKRLRVGQAHKAAAGGARYKLIGTDRGNAHGFHLMAGVQSRS